MKKRKFAWLNVASAAQHSPSMHTANFTRPSTLVSNYRRKRNALRLAVHKWRPENCYRSKKVHILIYVLSVGPSSRFAPAVLRRVFFRATCALSFARAPVFSTRSRKHAQSCYAWARFSQRAPSPLLVEITQNSYWFCQADPKPFLINRPKKYGRMDTTHSCENFFLSDCFANERNPPC